VFRCPPPSARGGRTWNPFLNAQHAGDYRRPARGLSPLANDNHGSFVPRLRGVPRFCTNHREFSNQVLGRLGASDGSTTGYWMVPRGIRVPRIELSRCSFCRSPKRFVYTSRCLLAACVLYLGWNRQTVTRRPVASHSGELREYLSGSALCTSANAAGLTTTDRWLVQRTRNAPADRYCQPATATSGHRMEVSRRSARCSRLGIQGVHHTTVGLRAMAVRIWRSAIVTGARSPSIDLSTRTRAFRIAIEPLVVFDRVGCHRQGWRGQWSLRSAEKGRSRDRRSGRGPAV
jgi:hypothetical protein